ncbi:12859_t:CDS:2 [Acaulospora morrowiae]|uniref:12859_t:CDS:1 n=1 Tax=Acaulospora morrowiae TaxID=94023 RepID=A0A9N8Z4Q3_9GLOM|nr:12859_t:CDS:2 [Acaulospora morrowiae]
MSDKYFDSSSAKWGIQDFLNSSDNEAFDVKIDFYIKTLPGVKKHDCFLINIGANVRKSDVAGAYWVFVIQGYWPSHNTSARAHVAYWVAGSLLALVPLGQQVAYWGNDRKLAKYWEATRRSGIKYSEPLINVNNINNSIFVSGGGTIGFINSGVNNNKTLPSRKRYQEEVRVNVF